MAVALWLLVTQGVIGAFDTLYYHEWRARLPMGVPQTTPELRLHAARDVLYAVLFGSLPWLAWQGLWVILLAAILLAEIAFTMADFVVETNVRKPLGDVYAGERVTHALMGIVYGAMITYLLPALRDWWFMPTALVAAPADVPLVLRWTLSMMAAGVLVSGARDLYATLRLPYGGWPWRVQAAPKTVA